MVRTAACLALLLGSITLTAQSGASSGANSTAPQMHSFPGSTVTVCPIDMHASQSLWNHNIAVQKGLANEKFGQRIALNLRDSRTTRIIGATVRVRGLNGKNRALPTPADTAQPWNAVKTLRVNFTEEDDGTVSADLWIVGFTAVGSIQLMSVSYSDGSVWTITESSACRVQPDPIMLITER